MYTRCPECETMFHLRVEDLRQAGGRVRCGECNHVFYGMDFLAEDAEPPIAQITTDATAAGSATGDTAPWPELPDDTNDPDADDDGLEGDFEDDLEDEPEHDPTPEEILFTSDDEPRGDNANQLDDIASAMATMRLVGTETDANLAEEDEPAHFDNGSGDTDSDLPQTDSTNVHEYIAPHMADDSADSVFFAETEAEDSAEAAGNGGLALAGNEAPHDERDNERDDESEHEAGSVDASEDDAFSADARGSVGEEAWREAALPDDEDDGDYEDDDDEDDSDWVWDADDDTDDDQPDTSDPRVAADDAATDASIPNDYDDLAISPEEAAHAWTKALASDGDELSDEFYDALDDEPIPAETTSADDPPFSDTTTDVESDSDLAASTDTDDDYDIDDTIWEKIPGVGALVAEADAPGHDDTGEFLASSDSVEIVLPSELDADEQDSDAEDDDELEAALADEAETLAAAVAAEAEEEDAEDDDAELEFNVPEAEWSTVFETSSDLIADDEEETPDKIPEHFETQVTETESPPWQFDRYRNVDLEKYNSNGGFLSACLLVLGLVLGGQLIHYNRDSLATHPTYGQSVRDFYAFLDLPLYPRWAITDYEIRGSEAVVGETGPDIMDIRTQIAAVGDQAVGLPILRVVLRDRWSNPVAARNFSALEYAAREDIPPDQLLRPNASLPAQLSIIDPGSGAQGYELELCIPYRHNQLECSGQAFK